MKGKRRFRFMTVLVLFSYFSGNNIFGAKVADYVNKSDVESAKKIFIYEVPKKVQTDKKKANDENKEKKNKQDSKNNRNVNKNNSSANKKEENKNK